MVATPKFRALGAIVLATVGVTLLLPFRAAEAQVDPVNSTLIGGGIQLGAQTGGVVEVRVERQVQIVPLPGGVIPAGTPVTITFLAGCAGQDLHTCALQPFPGGYGCGPTYSATEPTNGVGIATFRIAGFAVAGPGNTPGVTVACALVSAGIPPVIINNGLPVRVAAYDLNGVGGVNAADQALFLGTLFTAPAGYRTRCDYNGDGVLNSADLAKFLNVQFSGGSLASGGAASPCF